MTIAVLLPPPLRRWLRRHRSIRRLTRGRFEWLLEPPTLANEKVCLLASYSPGGTVSAHTLHLARGWAAHGYRVVLIVAADASTVVRLDPSEHRWLAGLAVRDNLGYDFGSWATALRACPSHRDAAVVATTNDSVYGPLDGFAAVLARVDASPADVVALADSHELQHHLQSFAMFYKRRALRSAAFRGFWYGIGAFDRNGAIREAELPQRSQLLHAGLTIETLFPAPPGSPVNRTLVEWKELVVEGFPFVKAELMRSNPRDADLRGWEEFVAAHGLDPTLIHRHLGPAFDRSAAGIAGSSAR